MRVYPHTLLHIVADIVDDDFGDCPGIDHSDGACSGAGLGEDFEVDDFVASEFHGGVELVGAEEFGVHDAGFALHEVVDEFAPFGLGGEVLSRLRERNRAGVRMLVCDCFYCSALMVRGRSPRTYLVFESVSDIVFGDLFAEADAEGGVAEGFDFLCELGSGDFFVLIELVGDVVAFGDNVFGDAHWSAWECVDVDVVGVLIDFLDFVVGDFVEDVTFLEF